jgi:hypothetical protein
MPARSGPGFEFEQEFRDYCLTHGVAAAPGTYRSCMNSIAAHLNVKLGPTVLRSENDVESIVLQVSETEFDRRNRSNFKSVLRKYVAMVRSNYRGLFDGFATPAVDVDPDDVPPRVRTEITRVIRDTALCRKIKRLYDYRCQRCGKRVELTDGEFYAEAHHLRPLAKKHGGRDVEENIICVCPTCHVLFDYSVVPIKPGTLKEQRHPLSKDSIAYHNAECAKRVS